MCPLGHAESDLVWPEEADSEKSRAARGPVKD